MTKKKAKKKAAKKTARMGGKGPGGSNPRVDYEALFLRYAQMGRTRSMRKLAEEAGVSLSTVSHASKRDGWMERIKKWDQEALDRVGEEVIDELADMNRRHLEDLRSVRDLAFEILEKDNPTANECLKAIFDSIKLERLVRGEATERTDSPVPTIMSVPAGFGADGQDWADAINAKRQKTKDEQDGED